MDTSEYMPMFLAETREHLQALNLAVVRLEDNPQDRPTVDEVFRIAHSLKGMSATMGFAKMAEGCGLKGVTVRTPSALTEALRRSCDEQKNGVTTFIEVLLNQELGEPFRRDAMKKPVRVAGIRREDMRAQRVA